MAYNTVAIKKDVDNKPIPQYYNPLVDAYEVLQGRNGANRVELYDANGNPVDLVGLITAIIDILNARNLPLGASTEEKQDAILAAINEVKTEMTRIREYYGKSTDAKPTGVPVGSTFFEIDTKQVYIFDGESWVML